MSARPVDRLQLTVLGCSTAAPHAVSPASGFLVGWGETRLLLDIGQGVVRRLQRSMSPTELSAVIVGHMHADHFIDLIGLRYLFPWGAAAARPLPVYLPPDGRARLDTLADAISERPGFFDASFDVSEFDPDRPLGIGPLVVRFVRGRHYVPAWGVIVEAPDDTRLGYVGDTGPSDAVVAAFAGVDLMLIEAAVRQPSHDDAERGHLTPEEAIEMAGRANVGSALLVHYPPAWQPELDRLCEAAGPWIRPAVAGLTVEIDGGRAAPAVNPVQAPPAAVNAAAARER
jgi:ribonuclease BN (tRNA processing enzyme)